MSVARWVVGWCAACDGPVLYAPEHHEASCPCGETRVRRAFMRFGGGFGAS